MGYVNLLQLPIVRENVGGTTCARSLIHAIRNFNTQNAGLIKENRYWLASEMRDLMEHLRSWLNPNVPYFGDKKGKYLHSREVLDKVFPDCKVIVTIRNYWDTAASLMECGFFLCEERKRINREELALRAYKAAKLTAKASRHAESYAHPVVFEEMAEAPEEELSSVLDFVGLDVGAYDFSVIEETHYPESVGHWKQIPELVELREKEE